MTAALRTSQAIADQCNVREEAFHGPHHPLYCDGWLRFYKDNSLACKHTKVPSSSWKLQQCIDYSIALCILEIACEKYGPQADDSKAT